MKLEVVQKAVEASISGSMNFGQIVGMLIEDGVEAYHVDYVRSENRYYNADGESYVVKVPHSIPKAAEKFSAESIGASVKKSQQGLINYDAFTHEATAAGCVYYIVYIKGRKVVYFGREGESHTEYFPNKS